MEFDDRSTTDDPIPIELLGGYFRAVERHPAGSSWSGLLGSFNLLQNFGCRREAHKNWSMEHAFVLLVASRKR
jgi:hypothetical protein